MYIWKVLSQYFGQPTYFEYFQFYQLESIYNTYASWQVPDFNHHNQFLALSVLISKMKVVDQDMVSETPGLRGVVFGEGASQLEYQGTSPNQYGLDGKAGSTGLQLNPWLIHNIPLVNIWE